MSTLKWPEVQGILLAGLHGWRESHLERVCRRPFLPVAGRPLVEYGLDWLVAAGARQISLCTDGSAGAFRRILRDRESAGVDYHEDPMPRGAAGCVRDASKSTRAGVLLVVESALLPWVDPRALLRAHIETGAGLTVVAMAEGSSADAAARHLEPMGIYVISRDALKHIPATGYQDIKEMWIPLLHKKRVPVAAHVVDAQSGVRVTGAASYLAANDAVLARSAVVQEDIPDYVRAGEAWIHISARVAPTAQLCGRVLVGPDSRIGPRARILGPTTIGRSCLIGKDAILLSSALWSCCEIGDAAIVDQSVVAGHAQVEAGLVVRDRVCTPDGSGRPAGDEKDFYWPAPCRVMCDLETEWLPTVDEARPETGGGWRKSIPAGNGSRRGEVPAAALPRGQ